MGIGANIKHLLKEQNKTITWLSEVSEINRNTLYSIIRKDDTSVRKENLAAIAKSLNVSIKDLFSDTLVETTQHQVKTPFDVTTQNISADSKKPSNQPFDENNTIKTDSEEFRDSIIKKRNEIQLLKSNSSSVKISKEELTQIISRKEDETNLLMDFFDLHPYNRKRVLRFAKDVLINQKLFDPDGTYDPFAYLDSTNTIDSITAGSYYDATHMVDDSVLDEAPESPEINIEQALENHLAYLDNEIDNLKKELDMAIKKRQEFDS